MKRTRKIVRSILGLLAFPAILTAFCLSGAVPALGGEITGISQDAGEGEQRVFDRAGLFSADESQALEQEVSRLRREMDMDVVIVTADDSEGMSAGEYADHFYIQGNFGKGREYDGILFLIDMDNRELYVDSVGKMGRYITDERREEILDAVYEKASGEDFAGAADAFLSAVSGFYQKGIQADQYNYDEETGKVSAYKSVKWYEALLAAVVSAFAGIGACSNVAGGYAMKKERKQAGNYYMAYRANCGFQFADQADNLLNKSVSQMIIPRSRGNSGGGGVGGGGSFSGRTTTHTSSGRTFSGGGRKF